MIRPTLEQISQVSKQYPGWKVGNADTYTLIGVNDDMLTLSIIEHSFLATYISYDYIAIGAARRGNVEMLSYAFSKGASDLEAIVRGAVYASCIPSLEYLYECYDPNVLILIKKINTDINEQVVSTWLRSCSD